MHVCIYIYGLHSGHLVCTVAIWQTFPDGAKNVLNLHLQVSNQKVSSDISVAAVDIELDDEKISRKDLYLMVKTMVSG